MAKSSFKFYRATGQNNLFAKLRAAWVKESDKVGLPQALVTHLLDYHEKVATENKPVDHYGVYILSGSKEGEPTPPYLGFVHVNLAHPKTKNPVLRLVWSALRPRLRSVSPDDDERLEVLAAFISETIQLAQTTLKAKEVKIWLGGGVDKQFARTFAKVFNLHPVAAGTATAAVRSDWLHIYLA